MNIYIYIYIYIYIRFNLILVEGGFRWFPLCFISFKIVIFILNYSSCNISDCQHYLMTNLYVFYKMANSYKFARPHSYDLI